MSVRPDSGTEVSMSLFIEIRNSRQSEAMTGYGNRPKLWKTKITPKEEKNSKLLYKNYQNQNLSQRGKSKGCKTLTENLS